MTLTFDLQNPSSSSLSPSRPMCHICRNFLKVLLGYHVHKNGIERQSENIMPLATAVTGLTNILAI